MQQQQQKQQFILPTVTTAADLTSLLQTGTIPLSASSTLNPTLVPPTTLSTPVSNVPLVPQPFDPSLFANLPFVFGDSNSTTTPSATGLNTAIPAPGNTLVARQEGQSSAPGVEFWYEVLNKMIAGQKDIMDSITKTNDAIKKANDNGNDLKQSHSRQNQVVHKLAVSQLEFRKDITKLNEQLETNKKAISSSEANVGTMRRGLMGLKKAFELHNTKCEAILKVAKFPPESPPVFEPIVESGKDLAVVTWMRTIEEEQGDGESVGKRMVLDTNSPTEDAARTNTTPDGETNVNDLLFEQIVSSLEVKDPKYLMNISVTGWFITRPLVASIRKYRLSSSPLTQDLFLDFADYLDSGPGKRDVSRIQLHLDSSGHAGQTGRMFYTVPFYGWIAHPALLFAYGTRVGGPVGKTIRKCMMGSPLMAPVADIIQDLCAGLAGHFDNASPLTGRMSTPARASSVGSSLVAQDWEGLLHGAVALSRTGTPKPTPDAYVGSTSHVRVKKEDASDHQGALDLASVKGFIQREVQRQLKEQAGLHPEYAPLHSRDPCTCKAKVERLRSDVERLQESMGELVLRMNDLTSKIGFAEPSQKSDVHPRTLEQPNESTEQQQQNPSPITSVNSTINSSTRYADLVTKTLFETRLAELQHSMETNLTSKITEDLQKKIASHLQSRFSVLVQRLKEATEQLTQLSALCTLLQSTQKQHQTETESRHRALRQQQDGFEAQFANIAEQVTSLKTACSNLAELQGNLSVSPTSSGNTLEQRLKDLSNRVDSMSEKVSKMEIVAQRVCALEVVESLQGSMQTAASPPSSSSSSSSAFARRAPTNPKWEQMKEQIDRDHRKLMNLEGIFNEHAKTHRATDGARDDEVKRLKRESEQTNDEVKRLKRESEQTTEQVSKFVGLAKDVAKTVSKVQANVEHEEVQRKKETDELKKRVDEIGDKVAALKHESRKMNEKVSNLVEQIGEECVQRKRDIGSSSSQFDRMGHEMGDLKKENQQTVDKVSKLADLLEGMESKLQNSMKEAGEVRNEDVQDLDRKFKGMDGDLIIFKSGLADELAKLATQLTVMQGTCPSLRAAMTQRSHEQRHRERDVDDEALDRKLQGIHDVIAQLMKQLGDLESGLGEIRREKADEFGTVAEWITKVDQRVEQVGEEMWRVVCAVVEGMIEDVGKLEIGKAPGEGNGKEKGKGKETVISTGNGISGAGSSSQPSLTSTVGLQSARAAVMRLLQAWSDKISTSVENATKAYCGRKVANARYLGNKKYNELLALINHLAVGSGSYGGALTNGPQLQQRQWSDDVSNMSGMSSSDMTRHPTSLRIPAHPASSPSNSFVAGESPHGSPLSDTSSMDLCSPDASLPPLQLPLASQYEHKSPSAAPVTIEQTRAFRWSPTPPSSTTATSNATVSSVSREQKDKHVPNPSTTNAPTRNEIAPHEPSQVEPPPPKSNTSADGPGTSPTPAQSQSPKSVGKPSFMQASSSAASTVTSDRVSLPKRSDADGTTLRSGTTTTTTTTTTTATQRLAVETAPPSTLNYFAFPPVRTERDYTVGVVGVAGGKESEGKVEVGKGSTDESRRTSLTRVSAGSRTSVQHVASTGTLSGAEKTTTPPLAPHDPPTGRHTPPDLGSAQKPTVLPAASGEPASLSTADALVSKTPASSETIAAGGPASCAPSAQQSLAALKAHPKLNVSLFDPAPSASDRATASATSTTGTSTTTLKSPLTQTAGVSVAGAGPQKTTASLDFRSVSKPKTSTAPTQSTDVAPPRGPSTSTATSSKADAISTSRDVTPARRASVSTTTEVTHATPAAKSAFTEVHPSRPEAASRTASSTIPNISSTTLSNAASTPSQVPRGRTISTISTASTISEAPSKSPNATSQGPKVTSSANSTPKRHGKDYTTSKTFSYTPVRFDKSDTPAKNFKFTPINFDEDKPPKHTETLTNIGTSEAPPSSTSGRVVEVDDTGTFKVSVSLGDDDMRDRVMYSGAAGKKGLGGEGVGGSAFSSVRNDTAHHEYEQGRAQTLEHVVPGNEGGCVEALRKASTVETADAMNTSDSAPKFLHQEDAWTESNAGPSERKQLHQQQEPKHEQQQEEEQQHRAREQSNEGQQERQRTPRSRLNSTSTDRVNSSTRDEEFTSREDSTKSRSDAPSRSGSPSPRRTSSTPQRSYTYTVSDGWEQRRKQNATESSSFSMSSSRGYGSLKRQREESRDRRDSGERRDDRYGDNEGRRDRERERRDGDWGNRRDSGDRRDDRDWDRDRDSGKDREREQRWRGNTSYSQTWEESGRRRDADRDRDRAGGRERGRESERWGRDRSRDRDGERDQNRDRDRDYDRDRDRRDYESKRPRFGD
ncbi:hypothetical protein HK102_013373 [Quaeritorhiza haematococci]|nr:hypothetical protein HK102_013373 [Quaeritorhiza haematococci]